MIDQLIIFLNFTCTSSNEMFDGEIHISFYLDTFTGEIII